MQASAIDHRLPGRARHHSVMTKARALWQLLRGQPRNACHAESLQRFYAPQAPVYDAWREGLLHGRRVLIEGLDVEPDDHVVELGGGTGRNLLFFEERLRGLRQVTLVDLCPALLDQARQRFAACPNVQIVEADAAIWRPPEPVDSVFFSYSLTMMPDWRSALDNAYQMLRPGGTLGVVDFYVSHRDPGVGRVRHSAIARRLWPRWFGHQGVMLNPQHLDYLCARVPKHAVSERRGPMPYLRFLRAPYYVFIGQKPE